MAADALPGANEAAGIAEGSVDSGIGAGLLSKTASARAGMISSGKYIAADGVAPALLAVLSWLVWT
jgi:hypothetical protein